MIRGSNELRFNGATMCDIVQYWLDNKWLNKQEPGPQVLAVEESNGTFTIKIEQGNPLPSR